MRLAVLRLREACNAALMWRPTGLAIKPVIGAPSQRLAHLYKTELAQRRSQIDAPNIVNDARFWRTTPMQSCAHPIKRDGDNATTDLTGALNKLLADMFALYLKTKNFHWHVSGPHFRDYHGMLDEQAGQIIGTTDVIAERVRKTGGTTLRSIGHIARLQRIADNDAELVSPHNMLAELREDNRDLIQLMREVHEACDEHGDLATASLIENWIDEAEGRGWVLFETGHNT
jgi:starvation-inducible DNA-binding protein